MTYSANATQVGGAHYAAKYQHWDLVWEAGMSYFSGQITKYVYRARSKNGLQDLEKALHFVRKYTELMGQDRTSVPTQWVDALVKFLAANPNLTPSEVKVLMLMVAPHGPKDLVACASVIEGMIEEYASQPGAGYVNQ